jgi:hypothetical protein
MQLHDKITAPNVNDSRMETHLQVALKKIQELTGDKKLQKEEVDKMVKRAK